MEQKLWTRNVYPTQSPTKVTHIQTSQSQESSTKMPDSEKDIKFPKAIRAVTDSRNSQVNRTLIICLDGTGDQFDNDNSNVVNLVACLKKDDINQLTYYQTGIGTYDERGMSKGFNAVIDMSFGSGLGVHIKDAYRFLMQNYNEGDKICLFGFSRGAYTVRCLAGMLHKVGLLPAHNVAMVNFAYNFYKDDSDEGWLMSADFKRTFCADVSVYFVGVWDCVASVGFFPRKLPFSKSPTNNVGHFRHAMALDEHRAKFKITQFANEDPSIISRSQNKLSQKNAHKISIFGRHSKAKTIPEDDEKTSKNAFLKRAITISKSIRSRGIGKLPESTASKLPKVKESLPTDALEVWFCGGHADVGGGAVHNTVRHVLARIPLRWMIRQCFECNTGIIFKTADLAEIGIDIPSVWPVYQMPKIPVVGPSPNLLNKYVAGQIGPLQRRSTALGLESSKPELLLEKTTKQEFPASNEDDELLPEQDEDFFDALAPINDQLKSSKAWWLLELWPVKIRRQKPDTDKWEKVVRPNLGTYRAVRESEPSMHWTVQKRMTEQNYKIRARVDRKAHWKVVV